MPARSAVQVDLATGSNVRAEMARRGSTQADIAALLGLSQVAVSSRLRGATAWRVSEVLTIAAHFDVPVQDLMGVSA